MPTDNDRYSRDSTSVLLGLMVLVLALVLIGWIVWAAAH